MIMFESYLAKRIYEMAFKVMEATTSYDELLCCTTSLIVLEDDIKQLRVEIRRTSWISGETSDYYFEVYHNNKLLIRLYLIED